MSNLSNLLKTLEQSLADKLLDPNFVSSIAPELVVNNEILYSLNVSFNGEEKMPAIVLIDINPMSQNLMVEEMDWVTVYFKCYSIDTNNYQVYDMMGLLRDTFHSIELEGYRIVSHQQGDLRFPSTIRGEMDGSELMRNRAKTALRVGTYKHRMYIEKLNTEE